MRRLAKAASRFLEANWTAVALVCFVLVLHWDLLTWAVPATGDHMIHLYKGWLMSEHMLPSGRLTGWSNMAFAGYPAGVYYPILGDLLVTATRYLTAGLLSWERTYAIFFLVLLVVIPLAAYAITRRFTGPFGALIAGVLMVGDVGGWPQGGYVSTVHWAVWPFILALTLTMFTILACDGTLEHPIGKKPLRYLGLAAILGCTVLAHPMSSFFLGLSAPLFVLITAIAKRREHGFLRVVGRATVPAVAALLLVGFWVLPWATTGDEWTLGWPAVGFGGMWVSLGSALERLARNRLFPDFFWLTWGLGGVGFALAVVSKRRWPIFVAGALVLSFLFVGLANSLGDGTMARKVQIERMAAFMKFAWFVLAGYAADRAAHGARWALERIRGRWERLAAWRVPRHAPAVLTLVVVSAIVAIGWSGSFRRTAKLGRLGGDLWEDVLDAERWLASQPQGPLDRVLHQPGERCVSGSLVSSKCNEVYHRHIFASAPVRTDLPKLKFGYEATAIFRNVPLAHRWPYDTELIQRLLERPEALESFHVRWIVSLVEWPDRPDIELVRRFGKVWVYEAEAGKGPPVRLEGAGTLEVLEFSDERVSVRVEGADDRSRLLYPIAHFYPWRAFRDGGEIPLGRHGVLPGVREVLMAVEARDGVTELVYTRPVRERAANWISLVSWCLLALASAALVVRRLRRSGAGA